MKKEWMKRRFVRIGLAAGALVAVVLAALWLCGVFAPAVELPSPSQALMRSAGMAGRGADRRRL